MKVFIDLGAYNGDTLDKALKVFPDFDRFYAFEPFFGSYEILEKKFNTNNRIKLFNCVAGIKDGYVKLFLKKGLNEGHSVCFDKENVSSDFVMVKSIDFSKFISETLNNDEVFLKVNIEGFEYDLFDFMIKNKSIRYVKKIFCEWHYFKMKNKKSVIKRHNKIIECLNSFGFVLTGDNARDNFNVIYP